MKKRHEEIRDYIVQYTKEYGYTPSYTEIGEALGMESKSTVYWYIRQMDELGIIKALPGQPRCISVPGYVYANEAELREAGGWFPASSPPTHGRDVLIRYTNGDYEVAYREGGRWRKGKYLTDWIDDIDVAAWRPLPE